jgi:hypothetical protein
MKVQDKIPTRQEIEAFYRYPAGYQSSVRPHSRFRRRQEQYLTSVWFRLPVESSDGAAAVLESLYRPAVSWIVATISP